MNAELTGYVFGIRSVLDKIKGTICLNSTDDSLTSIRGNPVNVFYSLLTSDFSESHATFPLTVVSDDTSISAAPTGLGISTASVNTTQLVQERDRWYSADVVEVVFGDSEDGRSHLEREFFRVFQAFPTVSGAGLIGMRFCLPPIPYTTAPEIKDTDHIVDLSSWVRMYAEHINKYTYMCEDVKPLGAYNTALYNTETAEDTADQSAPGETIELLLESRWLSDVYDGATTAATLAGRARINWLKTPAQLQCTVNFTKRAIEHGDFVAVTARNIPDLGRGVRGLDGHLMIVTSISPDFAKGVLRLTLMDTGYRRFGAIAPAATADYTSAATNVRDTFVYIGSATNNTMSNGDNGYRLL